MGNTYLSKEDEEVMPSRSRKTIEARKKTKARSIAFKKKECLKKGGKWFKRKNRCSKR